jgi:hypothetical protein
MTLFLEQIRYVVVQETSTAETEGN